MNNTVVDKRVEYVDILPTVIYRIYNLKTLQIWIPYYCDFCDK